MITLPTYAQTNPLWDKKVMAPSSLLVHNFGCMMTAFCMASHNWAISDDPGVTNDKFVKAGVYTAMGDFQLWKIGDAYPAVHLKERIYTSLELQANFQKMVIDAAIQRIKMFITLGQPVLLNVDLIGHDKTSDHWVVAYDFSDTDFTINDPAYGDKIPFSQRYGQPAMGIYGYAAFIGSPIAVPDSFSHFAGIAQAGYKLAEAKAGKNVAQNVSEALDTIYS